MATNPDRVAQPATERPATPSQDDLRTAFVTEMRAALATRQATAAQLEQIAAKYGRTITVDPEVLQRTIDWAKNPNADVNQIDINASGAFRFDMGGAGALLPEYGLPSEMARANPLLPQGVRPEFAYGITPTTRISAREPGLAERGFMATYDLLTSLGADKYDAQRYANRLFGLGDEMGLIDVTPGAAPIDIQEGTQAFQTGLRFGEPLTAGLGAAQALLGAAEAIPLVGVVARPVKGAILGAREARAAARAADLARPELSALRLTPEQEAIFRMTPSAEVPAIPTPRPAARPAVVQPVEVPAAPTRAAVAAPEVPPAPARAAAPEVPPVPVDAPPVERAAAIDNIQPGTAPFLATPESRASAMQTLVDIGETQPIISNSLNKRFSAFAADYLNTANLARPADIPFTEFFRQHIAAETLPLEEVQALARKHNLSELDIVEATTGYRVSANEWGRIGQTLSMASRLVPTEMGDLARSMGSAPPPSLWRRIGNAQRGLLVSQLATTMRNNLSSVARVGIDVATGAADTAINAALNPIRRATGRETVAVDPFNAFRMITQQFNPAQNRNVYRQLRNANAKINKELMATYNADIYRSAQKDKFSRVENAVEVLNTFNRVSEQFTRKAVFPVYLRRAYNRGSGVVLDGRRMSFDELANGNQLHLIPEDTFQRALNDTLDFTYSRQPKQDSAVDLFIRGIEKTGPIGATLVPFPRFMLNAARFQYEFSPASLLQVMFSPKQWRAIASGDTELLNRGIVGSMLLYAAYEFQNSQYAGSKWYMARTEDGNEVDLRPYFPAPFYLFLADVIKRYQDRTLDQAYTGADIVQGLTGAQFRAGAGLYAIDEAMRDLTGAGGKSFPESATTVVGNILANTGSAWLTPLGQFKDFVAEFDQGEAVRRDAQGSMLGTLLRTVPFAQQALGIPEQTYTTREGGLATQHPFLRQLLGATITPTNRLELELRQLGIVPSDLYSPEGIPGIDRRQRELIGMIASRNADQYLFTPEYAAANKIDQTDMVQNFYKEVRAAAREVLRAENPAVDMIVRFQDLDRENKIRVNEQYEEVHGQTFLEYMGNLSEQLMEAPLVSTQEEYDALPSGAKYTDPGDMKVYTKE